MTALPGDKPDRQRNFHDQNGRHIFPHPETYNDRLSTWTAWDRRYAAHLNRHKELIENPEPMPGDSPAIMALFEHMEVLKQIIAKEKLLIIGLRERAAQHPEADDLDVMSVLRKGGVES